MAGKQPDGLKKELSQAAKKSNFTALARMLDEWKDLDISFVDETGKTLLHHCAHAGDKDGVQILLDRGIPLDIQDAIGHTAVLYAAKKDYIEVAELLIVSGADTNIPETKNGQTPLHFAVAKNYQGLVQLLLFSGSDATARDYTCEKNNDASNVQQFQELIATMSITEEDGMFTLKCDFDVQSTRPEIDEDVDFSDEMELPISDIHKEEQDRMPEKLCRSKEMRSVIAGVAKMTHGNKSKDLCLQTRDIIAEKKIEFERLDISVDFSKGEPGDKFQMMCRKQTPEYSDANFILADTEEFYSDVFSYRLDRKGRQAMVTLNVPIYCEKDDKEELFLKTNNEHVTMIERTIEIGETFYAVFEVDLMTFDTFSIISRPWREKFEVTKNEVVLTSKNDKRIEIWIPQDTFTLPTKLYFQIMEPANPDLLDCPELEDIYASTPFYFLQTESREIPANHVQLRMPLPEEFGVGGHMQLFSGNFDYPSQETVDSWELKETKVVKRKDKNIDFDMKTLCIKCAVETKDSVNIGDLPSQMSTLYRLSRLKQYQIVFLTMTKRVSNNKFQIAIELSSLEKIHERKAYWNSRGFKNQTPKPTEFHSIKSKQLFKLTVSKMKFSDANADTLILLQMHPKRRNYQVLNVQISGENDTTKGNVNIIPLKERPRLKEENENPMIKQSSSERILTVLSVELSNDEEDNIPEKVDDDLQLVLPKRLSAKLNAKTKTDPFSKAFTNEDFLHALVDDFDDDWYKLFLLMGVSYADIETTLRDVDLDEDDKRLKFLKQWRDQNRTRDDLGIPKFLTAAAKGGRRDLCTTIQLLMKTWYDEPSNQKNRFWRWVDKAFKDPDLMSPQEYPKPMSDGFLVLLVHEIGEQFKMAKHLAINDTVLAKIKNDHILLTDDQKMMKILTMAKGLTTGIEQQTKNLLNAMKKTDLKDGIDWFIMSCDYWLGDNKEDKDIEPIQSALKGYRKNDVKAKK